MKTPYKLDLPENTDPFLRLVLTVAAGECGVREDPDLGPNRGIEVDSYLRTCGIDPTHAPPDLGYPWCMAFVYWCFYQACIQRLPLIKVPCPRTASVQAHWDRSRARKVDGRAAQADHSLVRPGMVFCKNHTRKSHTGFVVGTSPDGMLVTIEGNTNRAGSRDGDSVVGGKVRPWSYVELGYLDYSGMLKVPA